MYLLSISRSYFIIRMIPVYLSGCTSPCIQFYSSTFHQTMSDLIVSSHVQRDIFSYPFFCLLIAFNDDGHHHHHHHFRLNGDAFLFGLVRIIYFTTHPPTPLFTRLRKMIIFGGLAGRPSAATFNNASNILISKRRIKLMSICYNRYNRLYEDKLY